jgi:hypothetical protein
VKPAAILVVLACFATGCLPTRGQAIADRIRAANSPIVRQVDLSPANPLLGRGDEVFVFITDAATDAEALDLWCLVVLPAGARELRAGAVNVYRGGVDSSGAYLALHDPVCPEQSPEFSPT